MTLAYVVLMMAAFYLCVVAEFMLPTGGMLGATAVAFLAAAVWIAFSHSFLAGTATLLFALLTTPLLLMGLVRAWPHTPLGRRMLNRRPGEQAQPKKPRTTASGIPIEELVGRVGVAKNDLLPSGLVLVDGEKMDAVSSGMPIDAGSQVVVTRVELGRLHVRQASAEDLDEPSEPLPQSPPALEGPLESFDAET